MKPFHWLLVTVLFSAFFPSCVENIEMTGNDPFLIVECVLTAESQQVLTVRYSNNNLPIYDFEASISDLTSAGTEYSFIPYDYSILSGHIDFTPVPGHEYLLTVQIDSKTTITAKTTFPVPAEWVWQSGAGAWNSPYCMQVQVQKKSSAPVWMWGTYQGPSSSDSHIAQEIACNYPGADGFNLINRKLSAYCTDESGTYMHDRVLRLNINDDPAVFSVFPYDASSSFSANPDGHEVHAICVSEELDHLLRETASLNNTQSGGDWVEKGPESWFEVYDQNNYYTNIQGGTGIFGAYVSCKMTRL